MFDTFIWDFDGTLFDTYPIMLDSIMRTLKELEVPATEQEIYTILKTASSKGIAEKYALDFDSFTRTYKAYEAADPRIPISFAGTEEILARITAAGKKNLILTHRGADSTKALLAREGLTDYFTEIVGSDHDFPRKPDPTSVNYLVEKYQLAPERTVMIGDRTLDILAGNRAGIRTIFYDIEALIPNVSSDYRIQRMREMEKYC